MLNEVTYLDDVFVKVFRPQTAKKCPIVIFFHGILSSLKELGEYLPRRLADIGVASLLFDFRGHGQSRGRRGYISMQTLAEDAQKIINYARKLPWVDKEKIFALGHSLGTTACLLFSEQFTGLIVLAAPTKLWDKLNFIEKALYPVLYYLIALPVNFTFNFLRIPLEFKVPYKFKKRHIFKSENCARAAQIDLQKFSPGSNFELVCEHDNLSLAKKNNKPTLVIVGKYDRATGVNDSKKIFNLIPARNKELKIFENSGHSILLDQEGQEVADYIVEWVKKTLRSLEVS